MTARDAGGRRAAGVAALVAGLCALAAGIATVTGPGPAPADVGTLAPAAAPAPSGPAASPPASGPSPVPGSSSATVAPRPRSSPRTTPPPVPSTPTRVLIAGLRVDAPVDAVAVLAGGALRIPDDPARLGWWIGSAMPGTDRGTVVIAGHVDTAADGPGALFALEKLPMGARIDVRAGDRVIGYRAVARRSYVKRRLPADLFRPGTAPRLVLITCGGSFANGVYSHNVVLYAEPLG